MANTYTQITIHVVFAVKGRGNFIKSTFKDELFKYISGIVGSKNQKLLCINGMPDHVHILIGLEPAMALSDLIRDVKANSSRWINEKRLLPGKFEWQSGFSAFSHSRSQRPTVIKYIENQEHHHAKRSFRDEYLEMLRKFEVEYNEKYVFEFYGT